MQAIDWQWIFWLNVPIGLACIPLVLTRIDESFGGDSAIDLPGLALVTAGALGVVWGLVRGNSAGWSSPEIVLTLAAGLVLLVAFVAWERRTVAADAPDRRCSARAGSPPATRRSSASSASLFAAVFFFAQLLQIGLGYGPLEAGLRLLPWTGTFLLVAPLAGALADRIGERPLLVTGLLVQAVGLTWVALIAEPGMPYSLAGAPAHRRGRRGVDGDPGGAELGRRLGRAGDRPGPPRASTA